MKFFLPYYFELNKYLPIFATNYWPMKKKGFWYKAFDLYYDGFRNMKLGKTLWAIILIKLFIMFAILKVFFFPNYIGQHSEEGQESDFVATELMNRK